MTNVSVDSLLTVLSQYGDRTYDSEDQLFLYFAGHGYYAQKQGYVVCRDSKMSDAARRSYVPFAYLSSLINGISCPHIFVALDVCYGGAFWDKRDPGATRGTDEYARRSKEEFLRVKLALKTRKFMTSGNKEPVPEGAPGEHSPFAKFFLAGLDKGALETGYLTFSRLVTYVDNAQPLPRYGDFGDPARDYDTGSDFFFDWKAGPVAGMVAPPVRARSGAFGASGLAGGGGR